jgi:hypothetical protein
VSQPLEERWRRGQLVGHASIELRKSGRSPGIPHVDDLARTQKFDVGNRVDAGIDAVFDRLRRARMRHGRSLESVGGFDTHA